ncbi:hypothetical protein Fot_22918 [Forsythia ovata]|uniref:DUF2828 domain-containing protein n=1 Tax=Forsythia ovata TaxID=205694 RepID=A0ABD1UZE4_9LAMI
MEFLKFGGIRRISLAAKWRPSIDSSYDKATLIYKSIAKRIFSRESSPEYEGLNQDQYVYKVRNRLRKEVLVPLHQALKSPEVYVSAQQWESIPYNPDNKRLREYLENVKFEKAKITAGAVFPHEIIRKLDYI